MAQIGSLLPPWVTNVLVCTDFLLTVLFPRVEVEKSITNPTSAWHPLPFSLCFLLLPVVLTLTLTCSSEDLLSHYGQLEFQRHGFQL